MGLLVFSLDDDLDTDLDTPVWDGAFHDVVRYDALAREIERVLASSVDDTVVPPCFASLTTLSMSLRRLAASAANGTYRELFANDGIVGGFLNAAYAAARDGARHAHDATSSTCFDDVLAAQRRLDAVADELPDELRAPVLESFIALSRFRSDLL